MTISINVPPKENSFKPRLMVIGVGGAGANAVNNMIDADLEGVEFMVANTDYQSLLYSNAERKIQLGLNVTAGLGAGSHPEVGRTAAEEAIEDISEQLQGVHMAFIAAGMGGGTGTGAAPVIARLAREQGILTVGVVTRPFLFEGEVRARVAEAGIQELKQQVDTLIVIPNENLFKVADGNVTRDDGFAIADRILQTAVRGVTDLIVIPGRVNLDFADIRTVMREKGEAMMGTGEAEGEARALNAAEEAISNPLLDDVSMNGATEVLINITGGSDVKLVEIQEAVNRIRKEVDPKANIIFGTAVDPSLEGVLRISVVATGIDTGQEALTRPVLTVVRGTEEGARPAASVMRQAASAVASVPAASGPVLEADPEKESASEIVERGDGRLSPDQLDFVPAVTQNDAAEGAEVAQGRDPAEPPPVAATAYDRRPESKPELKAELDAEQETRPGLSARLFGGWSNGSKPRRARDADHGRSPDRPALRIGEANAEAAPQDVEGWLEVGGGERASSFTKPRRPGRGSDTVSRVDDLDVPAFLRR